MIKILILFVLTFHLSTSNYVELPWAQWSHHHVVWLNGKNQNQKLIQEMVQTYLDNDIKVGGVNIDSAWSTQFNNFQWDRKKFPDPEGMIKRFHAKDIKVILWATSLVNNDTQLYQEGLKNNYFLSKGKVAKWWHGFGAFVDFSNPEAKKWWNKQMDKVLDMGIDGWKCDGADPISFTLLPAKNSKGKLIALHQYGHQYYGSFYNYTRQRNPQGLIMSRPVDCLQHYHCWAYSPKYVMFAGWVGDQDSDFGGFQKAMMNLMHSAWNGYLNFGFDIAGYRGQHITKTLLLRWTQIGSVIPFMENGGNGPHQPWLFDKETIDIYRKFVNIHYELKSLIMTASLQAYKAGVSTIKPLARKRTSWNALPLQNYGYSIRNHLFVFPILTESGVATLQFPANASYVYYFDQSKIIKGGQVVQASFKLDEAPFFIRFNSILPVQAGALIVYPQIGNHKDTFIRGKCTDYFEMNYTAVQLTISINRFYKNQQQQVNMKAKNGHQKQILKFIGMNQYFDSIVKNGQNVQILERGNNYVKITIQLGIKTVFSTKLSTD